MRLTSTHNSVIKYVRSLARATVRRAEGVYVAEGVRLLRDAISTGQIATLTLYQPEMLQRTSDGTALLADLLSWGLERYEVDQHVLRVASQTENPSGAVAVLKPPIMPPLTEQGTSAFGVILDGVGDPGNAGTIARTALAAGAGYLLSTSASVDLYGPKVVRAGMGAHFHLPLYGNVPWKQVKSSLPDVALVAASAQAAHSMVAFTWPERCALVVGSEPRGLTPEGEHAVTHHVRIPMQPGVESLNASVAAGILIYAARASTLSPEPERYK